MHRRGILAAAISSVGAMFAAASTPTRAATASPAAAAKLKVVYHLNDFSRVSFALGNIRNHLDGVGGPDNVTIALVVHGPALKAFQTTSASRDVSHDVGEFFKAGLEFSACGNTMQAQHVTLQDLLPGFAVAAKGGVVRIAELQSQGYVYLKP